MTSLENSQRKTWQLSPDLLGIVDENGFFVQTNPAWNTTLGWSDAEIREMVYLDFLHPEDVERTKEIFKAMKQGAPALYFENRYRCKDGSYRWLSWVAVQENDTFVCSARDFTKDKERARALQSIADEVKLREQFVAILSHDLRNPLASIGAALRLARREQHNEKIGAMLTSINGSADRMAAIIDVTMDFARARLGGGIPVDLLPCDNFKSDFERVVDELRLAHPDRRITTSYEFEGTVTCDPARLAQLLSNLVANAITHGSARKPVTVKTKENNGQFVLTVSNAGKAIPESSLATMFEPFVRAQDNDSLQGLGLGLYIASQIANAHHGKLEVKSDKNLTSFILSIPLGSR